jgi:hypothetical protein
MSYQIETYDNCPGYECGVAVGELHTYECDIARCKEHGWQRKWCDGEGSTHTTTTFKGVFPGTTEAVELGLYARIAGEGKGTEPCAPDAPGAGPDLNTLYMKLGAGELTWNAELEVIE